MECPDCGAPGSGNFCSSCGASLGSIPCPACQGEMPAGSRFCTECGTRLRIAEEDRTGGGRKEATWWVAGGLLVGVLLLVAYNVLGSGAEGAPAASTGAVMQGERALGPAPGVDLSSMTPREAADRLFDRVMRALSVRDTTEVRDFLPMAIDAYELARPLDADGYFHLSLLQRLGLRFEEALRTAEEALEEEPDHLLNLSAAAEAAREMGDTEVAGARYERLLEVWDREMETGRREYEEHAPLMETLRQDAREFLGRD